MCWIDSRGKSVSSEYTLNHRLRRVLELIWVNKGVLHLRGWGGATGKRVLVSVRFTAILDNNGKLITSSSSFHYGDGA